MSAIRCPPTCSSRGPALARRSRRRGARRWSWLAPLLLSLAPPQGDPIADFRRLFGREADPIARVEAVMVLAGYESPRVVDELVAVLADPAPAVVDAAVGVLGGFQTRPPVARMLELVGRGSLEERLGLLNALAHGRYGDLTGALAGALADNRWEIRDATLRALAASRDPAAVALLEVHVEDPEPAVRCAALEGLALLAPEALLRRAPAALAEESWQVRACAIGALARVRDRRCVTLLVARLGAEEGRLRQDLADALARLTGRSFGLAAEPWERFVLSLPPDWVPPSEEELALLAARRAETREKYDGLVRFHGVETPSRAVVFVIDVSASMANAVVQPVEGTQDEPPRRIDLVKRELARAIEELPSYAAFNVLAFSTEVDAWRRDLTGAEKSNKRSALRWVERLEPVGSEEERYVQLREDPTPARLASLLDLEGGRTNTHGALMQALGVAGRGAFDRHYEVGLDTILFLSDGSPSHGEVIAPDDILREVARANRLRRVAIHTIAIGEFHKDFMASLARQNGGVFVDLGK